MSTEVGFIGVGQMGSRMVRRLLLSGLKVAVCDVSKSAVSALVEEGARALGTPAQVAREVGTVLVCLPSPAVVRDVVLGDSGLLQGQGAMTTYVDLSTTGPRTSREVAEAVQARHIAVLDAPVSGGTAGAAAGTLTVMVSGPLASFGQCQSIFQAIGRRIVHVGTEPGQAQVLKVINNLLEATALAVTSEGMVLGSRAGLDPKVMLEVINASSGRNSATEELFPVSILPRAFDQGFALGLAHKDLRLCMDFAAEIGVPVWVGSAVEQLFRCAMSMTGPASDFTEVVKVVEEWAGIQVHDGRGETAEVGPNTPQ